VRRHLFIVSRDELELYAYLKEQFGPDSEVEVILDRRRAERRVSSGTAASDRRRRDRRTRADVQAELRLESHVFVTVEEEDSERVRSRSLPTGVKGS
jgi:hypothetical protein